MKRLILLILTAVLLVLPAAAYCGESAEEELTFEYSGRGQGLFRLGNTGYLVENCKDWMDRNYANNIRRNAKASTEIIGAACRNVAQWFFYVVAHHAGDDFTYRTVAAAACNDISLVSVLCDKIVSVVFQ